MAIIFMDGAEKNSLDQWTTVYNASVLSSSGLDMSGSYGFNCTNITCYILKTLSSSYSELYIQFRCRPNNLSNARSILQLRDSAGSPIALLMRNSTTGVLELHLTHADGALLASGTTVFNGNQTYLLKVYYKPLNSGGVFTVWIDGVQEVTYSGDTTNGLENVKTLKFGSDDAGRYTSWYFDDIVVSTTDITQNLKIAGKAIAGAGTTTQWDASAGSNYECVDEIPPSGTDYNSTNVTDEIDTFALADCTEDIGSIAAVQAEISALYEGSPTPTHVQAVLRVNGTNYFSSSFSPPSSLGAPHVAIWETNPDDSAAWEEADINALEVGYKAVA